MVTGGLSLQAWRVRGERVVTGAEGLIDEAGVARTALDPDGKVFVHGETWRARAEEPIAAGQAVAVVAVEGLQLVVRPIGRT